MAEYVVIWEHLELKCHNMIYMTIGMIACQLERGFISS